MQIAIPNIIENCGQIEVMLPQLQSHKHQNLNATITITVADLKLRAIVIKQKQPVIEYPNWYNNKTK